MSSACASDVIRNKCLHAERVTRIILQVNLYVCCLHDLYLFQQFLSSDIFLADRNVAAYFSS